MTRGGGDGAGVTDEMADKLVTAVRYCISIFYKCESGGHC